MQTAAVCPGMTGEAQVSQVNSSEKGAGIQSVHALSSSCNQHFDNSPYNDLAAFFMALSPSTGLPTVTGCLHHRRAPGTDPLSHGAGSALATLLCAMPPLGDKPP